MVDTFPVSDDPPETYKCSKQDTVTVQVPRAISTIAIQAKNTPASLQLAQVIRAASKQPVGLVNKVGDVLKVEGVIE